MWNVSPYAADIQSCTKVLGRCGKYCKVRMLSKWVIRIYLSIYKMQSEWTKENLNQINIWGLIFAFKTQSILRLVETELMLALREDQAVYNKLHW